jgi:hypothetical protein
MSDSDNDDGPGLQGILWGNLGEGDRLDLDYMPQVCVLLLFLGPEMHLNSHVESQRTWLSAVSSG